MKRITDQLMVMIYSLLLLSFQEFTNVYLVAFLTALIYVCLNYYLLSEPALVISTVCMIAAMLYFPEFALYLPVIVYSPVRGKKYVLSAVLAAVGMLQASLSGIGFLLLLSVGCMIAVVLNLRTGAYEALNYKYRKMRDDSAEKNMLLKEKNQTLLENQDYEVYTATLRERNRIAREIHDNVGHMLSRSILMVGALRTVNKDENMKEPLDRLDETLNEAMTSIRSSVHDLHDDAMNLRDRILDLTNTFIFCDICVDYDMGYEVPREVKYGFIAIAKEALSNVMKHSNATEVRVTVREHPGLYQMVVEDNGTVISYREEQEESGISGMGLQNMKDRVEKLKGTLSIQTEKGFGIYIMVPKKEGMA